MDLIPGLPDDLARECLARVPYSQFSSISSVCKAWKSELLSPEFHLFRKQICKIQKLIVVPHINFLKRIPISPVQFTVLEPETGVWFCLPPVPDLPSGLPLLFWEVISCMSSFILLVRLENWMRDLNVFVFDFSSFKWRRRTNMSSVYPISNGWTFDGDRMLYLLCNRYPIYNPDSNSRSIIAYDTAKDNWTALSSMSISDGSYRAIFHHGKIHIACQEAFQGPPTWRSFDVSTLQWNLSPQQKFLDSVELLRAICNDHGEWHACNYEGNVLALKGSTWEAISKLPSEVRNAKFLTLWKRKLVVLGSKSYDCSCNNEVYELDLKDRRWRRVETPTKMGYVRSACSVEI